MSVLDGHVAEVPHMALFPSGVKPSYLEEPVSEVKYVC